MPTQDFTALHTAMKSQVDQQFLPDVSTETAYQGLGY